ncbi:MAG TPA: ATP-binding cassette domain-containing protein [Streptosporangiaceae bacterium]|nr:ATP-binding cassette domain-containing protein [Streptosporangiaceae bacterium]
MSDTVAVAAHELSKSYGRHRAIEDVSFEVRRGQICGLLGPNGAGKTSTMRVLVGLSRPDHGTAQLLGEPSQLAATVLARVGVAIDGPAFVPHLSGHRNLELLWRAGKRRWPPPALEPSLELAGLGDALDRKVKSYSMGMRQRLMLAQALMGAPEVLILDEPANGLDPGEVRKLREHLRRLAADGTAVLISSHLLAEIEMLATHCVVLKEGTLVTAGKLEDLLGTGAYEFEVEDAGRAEEALRAMDGVKSVETRGDRLIVYAPDRTATELNQALVMAGVGVKAVRSTRSLEDVFLGLVERNSAAN